MGGRYKGGFKDRFVVNAVVASGEANGICPISLSQNAGIKDFISGIEYFYQNISQINSYIRPLQLPLDSISSESGHNSVFIWTPVLFTFHSYPDSGLVRIPVLSGLRSCSHSVLIRTPVLFAFRSYSDSALVRIPSLFGLRSYSDSGLIRTPLLFEFRSYSNSGLT